MKAIGERDHARAAAKQKHKVDLADLWGDESEGCDGWLEGKRDDAAIALTGMLATCGMSFADLARKLGWKPSRVSRALSGRENLTLNTIAEIVRAAGFDFDLKMRPKSAPRAFQPWEEEQLRCDVYEQLQRCETLLEAARAMHNSAEKLAHRAFRNPARDQLYATVEMQAAAANEECHSEMFEFVAA